MTLIISTIPVGQIGLNEQTTRHTLRAKINLNKVKRARIIMPGVAVHLSIIENFRTVKCSDCEFVRKFIRPKIFVIRELKHRRRRRRQRGRQQYNGSAHALYNLVPHYMKFWRHFNLVNLAIFLKIAKLKCTKLKCR